MPTTNEALYDAAVRHQVFLIRYGGATANKITALLDQADADLVAQIEKRLAKLGPLDLQELGRGKATTQRLVRMLDEIRTQNADLHKALNKTLTGELVELTDIEARIVVQRLHEAVGVDLGSLRPPPEVLRAAVTSEPFAGRLLKDWVKDLERGKLASLGTAVQLGVVEAQTIPQITNRVADAIGVSKRKAETLARTSVNHIGNRARELTYEANADVIKALRWTSTLDSRTSPICYARDGDLAAIGATSENDLRTMGNLLKPQGARPPAHPNCRSLMTPVTRSWDELSRKGALHKARPAREIDEVFRKQLKARGLSDAQIAGAQRNTRSSMNGQVPKGQTYEQWLRRQPEGFQNEVLGPSKAKLFRKGGLELRKFVDGQSGRPFTLSELKKREGEAWSRAFGPKGGPQVEPLPDSLVKDLDEAQGQRFVARRELREAADDPKAKALFQGKISNFKTNLVAGKKPSGAQQAAFDELKTQNPQAAEDLMADVAVQQAKKAALAEIDEIKTTALGKQVHAAVIGDKPLNLKTKADPTVEAAKLKEIYAAEKAAEDQVVQFIASEKGSIEDQALNAVFPQLTGGELPSAQLKLFQAEIRKIAKAQARAAAKVNAEASEQLAAIEAKAKGLSVENKALGQLQKNDGFAELGPAEKLAQVQGLAETLKQKSALSSKLSGAKKKLAAGEQPTPAQQAAIDGLDAADKETFDQAVAKLQGDQQAATQGVARVQAAEAQELLGDDLERIGDKPGGSLPGFKARHKGSGEEWIVKFTASEDVARNEVLAAQLYRLAGVEVPDVRLVRMADGRPAVASKVIADVRQDQGLLTGGKAPADVMQNFAVDAWLANWDAVGLSFDNLVFAGGRAVRIDVGGALRYRAQGGLKGAAFGDQVTELKSLRTAGVNQQSAQVFGKISKADLEAGVSKVLSLSDEAIRGLVERYGPLVASERAGLLKTLLARRDDLAKAFPHLVRKSASSPLPTGQAVTDAELSRISESRANGYTITTDKGDIEDHRVLYNFEKAADGSDLTVANLKVRGAGVTTLRQLTAEISGAPKFDDGGFQDRIIEAIKGVAHTAAAKNPLRDKDVERIRAAKKAFDEAKGRLKAQIAAGKFTDDSLEAFEAHYGPWMQALEKAAAGKVGSTATFASPSKSLLARFTPTPAEVKAGPSIRFQQRQGIQRKKVERGFAQQTDEIVFSMRGTEYVEATVDGVRIRYWPDSSDTLFALRNRLEITAPSSGREGVEKVKEALKRLGIANDRATALDREELYLAQIVWHRRDNWADFKRLAEAGGAQEERVQRMREWVSSQIGKDITKLEGYDPDGAYQAFETGRKVTFRPDLQGAAWAKFQAEFRLHHNLTSGGSVADNIEKILQSGGQMAPTTDKLRRGIAPGGMSPSADLGTGGAEYFFTRIKKADEALRSEGLVWKARTVARLDAISYNRDNYGRVDSENFVLSSRKTGISEWRQAARAGSNETIIKGSLSIFDDLDAIVVSSLREKMEVMEVFKRHKIDRWPDGRPLEEVVKVR